MSYTVTQVRDRVWAIQDGPVRVYLLDGGEEAVLVDTGYGSGDLLALVGSLVKGRISVVNTHGHGDHISGNKQFSKFYVGAADSLEIQAACPPDAEVISVRDGAVITAGDIRLKVIEIPGHTPGSIALLDEGRRLLFSGDAVAKCYPIYMQYPGQDLEKYHRSLMRLYVMEKDYDMILPAHGELQIEKEYLPRTIACCKGILNQTLAAGKAELFDGSLSRAAWYEDVAIFY